jgi:hypothetical protein
MPPRPSDKKAVKVVWSDWHQVGFDQGVSGVAALATSSTLIDVFVTRTDGTLYRRQWDEMQPGSGWGPIIHGLEVGQHCYSPSVASLAEGRIDLFAMRGPGPSGHGVEHRAFANSAWGAWHALPGSEPSPGASWGTFPRSITAMSCQQSRVDCFSTLTSYSPHSGPIPHPVRWIAGDGGDGPGSWSSWQFIGPETFNRPVITSWRPNRMDLFVLGTDKTLYHTSFDGSWADWEPVPEGDGIETLGAGCCWGEDRIDVFGTTASGDLIHVWWDANRFRGQMLDGTGTPLAAVSRGKDTIDLFGCGTDGSLIVRTWGPIPRPRP